jgi:hypothetical protein
VQEVLGERVTAPIEFIVTDSFFKNYCNIGLPTEDHGDFSSRYSKGEVQRTVLSPTQAEQLFSQRALDFLLARFARFRQVRVQYQTVCSRSGSLDRLLEELAQSGPNLPGLVKHLQERSATSQLLWLDDLSGLDDRAKNFILSMGILGFSESWCSWEDFQALKPAFRQRTERLVQTFADTGAERYQPVLALVGNRYAPAFFPRAMQEHLGFSLRILLSQLDLNSYLPSTKMIVVEEGLKLDYAQSKELLRYSRELGKTLVVVRSSLCERAQAEFAACRSFQLKHGWEYSISLFPSGGAQIGSTLGMAAGPYGALVGASAGAILGGMKWVEQEINNMSMF